MFKIKASRMDILKKEKGALSSALDKKYATQTDLGREWEERALNLTVQFLGEVDDAFLGEKARALDVYHKVDLVVETGSYYSQEVRVRGYCIGLQVKKSEEGARKHQEGEASHTGEYGYPAVIVAGPHRSGWDVLMQISEATGLPINQLALDALAYAHAYKGSVRDLRCFRRPGDIIALGLARKHPKGLLFVTDPPPMP